MRAFDRGVPRAEPRADVEGGRAAAADDDVVRVGVMFEPPSYVVAGGARLCRSLLLRWRETGIGAHVLILYVFSPYNPRAEPACICIIRRPT
jgi:hypothetical protein